LALFDDALKGENILITALIVTGVAVATPVASAVLRPLAKTLIKGGLLAYDYGRQALSGAGDLFEEARTEVHMQSQAAQDRPMPRGDAQTPPVTTIPPGEPAAA
jgi:hypothetical protein